MKAGLFYKHSINIKKSLTVNILPDKGTNDCLMGIYTADHSTLWGWRGCDFIANVSSVNNSSSKYTKKGIIDGVYFRNWSGQQWTGHFELTWK